MLKSPTFCSCLMLVVGAATFCAGATPKMEQAQVEIDAYRSCVSSEYASLSGKHNARLKAATVRCDKFRLALIAKYAPADRREVSKIINSTVRRYYEK